MTATALPDELRIRRHVRSLLRPRSVSAGSARRRRGGRGSVAGMEATVFVLGLVVALAAAVRSTWSPCGQSMLSQLTPVGEASRGYRYRTTAAWFVAGAIAGGAMLGGVMAVFASAVSALGATSTTLLCGRRRRGGARSRNRQRRPR